MDSYAFLKSWLFALPPEWAHAVVTPLLKLGWIPSQNIPSTPRLTQSIFNQQFPHPLGLAAGFDKNATLLKGLQKCGFSFVETGTVTPLPQKGNSKPRLFRLQEDQALINRLGFNNHGIEAFHHALLARPAHLIIGANIGKNKDTKDPIVDYVTCLENIYGLSDYITINISSPNTPNLRQLQQKDALDALLSAINEKYNTLIDQTQIQIPLLLKIAPDMHKTQAHEIAQIVMRYNISGMVISNTTLDRPKLTSKHKDETGGLSGVPLFQSSTRMLALMYHYTEGTIPLIGVGGISNAVNAYQKIRAGASLLQIYTAFIYQGISIVPNILSELDRLLTQDGFNHISQVIGVDSTSYL